MGKNAVLSITDGERVGTFDLGSYNKDVVTIGRSKNNDIVVNNLKVSHQHGKFFRQGGIWFYQDLNSTNGTIVNGKKISSVSLNMNDVMVFDTVPGNDSLKIDVRLVEDSRVKKDPIDPVPPTPVDPAPPPKPNMGKAALIISLSVILVAAIVIAVVLILKNNGINGSPEKAAVNFIEGVAARDNEKMKKSVHEKMQGEVLALVNVNDTFSGITMEEIKAGTPVNVSSEEMKLYKTALKLDNDLDLDDAKLVRVT